MLKGYQIPELTLVNLHPNKVSIWPFMSAVSVTYMIMAPEGLKLGASIAYPIGILFAVICFVFVKM